MSREYHDNPRVNAIAMFQEAVHLRLMDERSAVQSPRLYRRKSEFRDEPSDGAPHIIGLMGIPRPEWINKGTDDGLEILLLATESAAMWAFEQGYTQSEIAAWWGCMIRCNQTQCNGWTWSAKARWAEMRERANRHAEYKAGQRAEREARWKAEEAELAVVSARKRKKAAKLSAAQLRRARENRQSMASSVIGTV